MRVFQITDQVLTSEIFCTPNEYGYDEPFTVNGDGTDAEFYLFFLYWTTSMDVIINILRLSVLKTAIYNLC